ncbi:MAG: hypothetical protein V1842_00010 [Candidatus Omnitrophota bacterium]
MKKANNQKGISLIFTLFLTATVFASLQLVFFSHISSLGLNQAYTNSLQVLYSAEAARNACLWELAHAPTLNTWDTRSATSDSEIDSTPRLKGSSITSDFYALSGYNFRAKVYNDGAGTSNVYIHAYRGDLARPKSSKYMEYVVSSTPTYQFFFFTNGDLIFKDSSVLYSCNGAKIHSNKNIEFRPAGTYNYDEGMRFNNLTQMTANGTIKYGKRYNYPDPIYLDRFDSYDEDGDGNVNDTEYAHGVDGMAPAPFALPANTSSTGYRHYYTTNGANITPGPFYCYGSDGYHERWWYGSWLSGSGYWEYLTTAYPAETIAAPAVWRGEETYFYGRQYNSTQLNWATDERDVNYLDRNGNSLTLGGLTPDMIWPAVNASKLYKFYLSADNSTLQSSETQEGSAASFYTSNVIFKPYRDDSGNINNQTWFEIPASLPQTYTWPNKYNHYYSSVGAIKFYATENCIRVMRVVK